MRESMFTEAVRALELARTRQDAATATIAHRPIGRHAFVDLTGCDPETLNDAELLATVLVAGCRRAGATVRDVVVTRFDPQGCTVVAVLEESHASIHTYPEHGQCFIDAFTCGGISPRVILSGLIGLLNPGGETLRVVERGTVVPRGTGPASAGSDAPQAQREHIAPEHRDTPFFAQPSTLDAELSGCTPSPAPAHVVDATGELFVCRATGRPWSQCGCRR